MKNNFIVDNRKYIHLLTKKHYHDYFSSFPSDRNSSDFVVEYFFQVMNIISAHASDRFVPAPGTNGFRTSDETYLAAGTHEYFVETKIHHINI